MFLEDSAAFRHAEEARFTDDRRRGRIWDGFVGPAGLEVNVDEPALAKFKRAIQEYYQGGNVHVEAFERVRPSFDGEDRRLVQVTIYREGRSGDILEFVEGALDRRARSRCMRLL